MADKTVVSLPLSRVRTIMKSSPDVSSISQEALFATGKATFSALQTVFHGKLWSNKELFIQALAKFSLEQNSHSSTLDYKDLAEIINSETTLQFLQDIIPKKIKYREYLAMCGQSQHQSM